MKKYLNLTAIIAFSLIIWSCNLDTEPRYELKSIPQIEPLTSGFYDLNKASANFIAETFSFTQGSYGFSAAPLYVLEADDSKEFADPLILAESNRKYSSVTVEKFNIAALVFGGTQGNATTLYLRLKTLVAGNITLYSEPIDITIIPYYQHIVYPRLYLPGNYQGWDITHAPYIESPRFNKKYRGYIDMVMINTPDEKVNFKFTTDNIWGKGTEYGDGGAPGVLKVKGADIAISPQGYYLIEANLNDFTYKATVVERP